ncbi:hypothetical protein BDR03DRAFT_1018740 [Suillus americanus]|nr:hypothetical protein BDR03DRAFT_1018740 [Suillus americanus]
MLRKHTPEADINDTSNTSLILIAEPPDPFSFKKEDIIWNLCIHLALSQELCVQYEINLGARDGLIQALTQHAEVAEKEKEMSRNILCSWKKKAGELECMCHNLKKEVDTSQQESLEHSVMDEASGEALCMLHCQISQLKHEKEVLQDNVDISHLHDQLRKKNTELDKLCEEIKSQDDAKHLLCNGIQEAREQMDYNTSQHETHITSVTAELTFANENVSCLESNIQEHDTSISTLTTTLLTHTDEAESLHEELITLKVKHSRAFSSQTCALQDLQTQEKDLHTQLKVAAWEKAENDISLGSSCRYNNSAG